MTKEQKFKAYEEEEAIKLKELEEASFKITAQTCAEEENGPEIKLVCGVYAVGKMAHSNEDAYFIHERGLGVADGVSGWNDYGFSSSEFSTQLMNNCKSEIENALNEQRVKEQNRTSSRMKQSGSYLSMTNLDLVEGGNTQPNNTNEQAKGVSALDNE